MPASRDHAQAFLDSLYPCGEMAYLANHTRSFLAGSIGKVPMSLSGQHHPQTDKDATAALAKELRELADALERGTDNDPF